MFNPVKKVQKTGTYHSFPYKYGVIRAFKVSTIIVSSLYRKKCSMVKNHHLCFSLFICASGKRASLLKKRFYYRIRNQNRIGF